MTHIRKQLTEAELRDEIARIQDGAKSCFENEKPSEDITEPMIQHGEVVKRKRGRPVGSKNRPKEHK